MRWTPLLLTAILAAGCASDPSKDADTDADTDVVDSDTATTTGDTDTGLIANDSGGPNDSDTTLPDTDVPDTDPNACGPGEVRDCNDECYSQIIIGDHFCDDGPLPQANFNCATFQMDGGDCDNSHDTDDTDVVPIDTGISDVPCVHLNDVRDCNGDCYPVTWLGDLRCDHGQSKPWGHPDFDCFGYQHDHGDCLQGDTDLPDTDIVHDTDVPDTDTVILDTDVDTDDTDTATIVFDTWPAAPDTDLDTDTSPIDTDISLIDTDISLIDTDISLIDTDISPISDSDIAPP